MPTIGGPPQTAAQALQERRAGAEVVTDGCPLLGGRRSRVGRRRYLPVAAPPRSRRPSARPPASRGVFHATRAPRTPYSAPRRRSPGAAASLSELTARTTETMLAAGGRQRAWSPTTAPRLPPSRAPSPSTCRGRRPSAHRRRQGPNPADPLRYTRSTGQGGSGSWAPYTAARSAPC